MTLRPIQGAPTGAPVPNFPTGTAGPAAIAPSPPLPHSVEASLPSLAQPPMRLSGPIDFHDGGNSTLTFRVVPELPAISRSSMTISVTSDQTGDYSPKMAPHFELATDAAKTFLLALRDGASPMIIADSRSFFQLEYANSEAGPTFTVSKPGQAHTQRRFPAGRDCDVKAMAVHLLADLGP